MAKARGKTNRHRGFSPGLLHFLESDGFTIASWCRDDKARLPPEQVHLIQHLKLDDIQFDVLMRFKSPDTLGFMIEELARYRREVWPASEPLILDGIFPEEEMI